MNVKEQVYQALVKSKKLTALLAHDRKGRCIYPMRSPDAGSYPILVGTAVGIKDIMAEGEGRKGIYDLSGRRLSDSSKLAKGIYIINGKKMAVGK